jgi:Ca2+-binding RTX toxin-like protein
VTEHLDASRTPRPHAARPGRSRASTRGLPAVGAVLLLASLLFAGGQASAAVNCTFSGGTVSVTITAPNEAATIARTAGGQIEVGGAQCGAATVTNTDKITVAGALGAQAVRIDLANGGFAPGATAEGTGTPEIEFEIDLMTGNETTAQPDRVSLNGTGAADTLRMGTLGINANGDDDADITGPAGGGTTTIRAEAYEVAAQGGPDVISGAAAADVGGAFPIAPATSLDGGPGPDQLTGGDSSDTLIGGPGNDTENGGNNLDVFKEDAVANGSDDFVGGGSPYDTLDYGQRSIGVTVDLDGAADDGQPGAENDNAHADIEAVNGGSGADTIADNSGAFQTRTLQGGGDDDTITGGPAGDSLYGQGGNDTMHGGPQGDTLYGGQGDDDEFGDAGVDRFYEDSDLGGASVTGPNGADEISGGTEADDVIYTRRTTALVVTMADGLANDGADTTPGGAAEEGDNIASDVEGVTGASSGINGITGNGLDNILAGGALDDTIKGLSGADDLVGGNGGDSLYGGAQNDRLQGVSGDDQLFGQADDDNLLGGFENDTMVGGTGNDAESGASGDDTFLQDAAANGNDTLDGSFDTDSVSYADRTARVVVDIDGAADDGDPAAAEHDTVTAAVENLEGGAGNDDLMGSTAPNSLVGNAGVDNLVGLDGNDLLDGGLGADAMEGDVGTDTATYANRTAALVVTIDGVANDGAAAEGDNVKADVENLVGGSAKDALTGSGGPNEIRGGAGNDAIAGGPGDDDEYGEDGNDTFAQAGVPDGADDLFGGANLGGATVGDLVDYDQRATSIGVTIDDAADDGASGESDNVHADVESARGGTRGDVLVGSPGPNQLFGLGGPDSLDGGLGPDVLSGGGAVDTATYASRTARLEVSLNDIANDGEEGELDNVRMDVENVTGGSSNDAFFGSTSANRFRGGLGNDFLDAGHPGADVFEGGGNYDTVDYSSRSTRVAVSIDGAGNDGTDADADGIGEEGDNVQADVEDVVGGSGNDLLVASDDPSFIEGLWGKTGDDVLRGLGGTDTFRGGPGADVVEGGNGTDRMFYDDHLAAVTVSLDDVANDGNAAASENDNVKSDVEDVWGGSGNDQLTGDGGPNKLFGDAGNDHLDGLGGDDELRGGEGSDFLEGGGGADLLQGDAGSDYAEYDTYVDPVVVTLDDVANDGGDTDADGTADEGDNVDTDHVFGGSGNDDLSGDSLPNQLYGNAGDDTLHTWGGNDDLTGGDGADSENGGSGNDIFHENGASGSGGLPDEPDDIFGDEGSGDMVGYGARSQSLKINIDDAANDGATDVAYTEGDNVHTDIEQVIGGAGNDDIQGSAGANVLSGSDGNDILRGVEGNDTLSGGNDNDAFQGGDGNDVLNGNAGDDNLDGDPGKDTVNGGDGADVGGGDFGDDTLNGGPGNDHLNGQPGQDQVNGGDGADSLWGSDEYVATSEGGTDVIHGDAGNDSLNGGAVNDTLFGDGGNDVLVGGNNNPGSISDGEDTLYGGVGDDTLHGGRYSDQLFGEEGNDTMNGQYDCDLLDGGPGADSMDAGEGISCDAVTYASRTSAVFVDLDNVANDGGDADSDGTPDEGDNIIHIQRVIGGFGDDSFVGDNAYNAFCGGGGDDTLDGAAGDDGLVGGPGDDTLLGSAGNDQLGTVAPTPAPESDCPTSDAGQDSMHGQADNDTFKADDGALDHLFGGAGTDGGAWDTGLDVIDSIP